MSDDTAAYKVCLNEANSDNEFRRFVVDRDVSTSYTYLYEKLATIFPTLRRANFKLTWTDEDGDKVTIRSDDELVIALTEMKGPVYKLAVEVEAGAKKADLKGEESFGSNSDGEEHPGVSCDNCESTVVGFRYKCVTCPDYHLCGKCESKGLHPGHTMIRIATPQAALPHHFYRRLHRMNEKMQKRSSTCPGRGQHHPRHHWASASAAFGMPGCPEGTTEGSNGATFHPECGRMQGNKWLEAMMKGWAGASEVHQASHQAAQEAVKKQLKTAKAFHDAAHGAATENASSAGGQENKEETRRQSGTYEDLISSTLGAAGSHDFLKNLGQIVAGALDPLGVDVTIKVETPIDENSNEKKAEETTPAKDADSHNDETTTTKNDDSSSSQNEEHDWTVIKTPQEQTTREVPIQTPDNLYPELPQAPQDERATPVVPEVVVEKKKEPEREVVSKPDPKIRVALQAMMNMGFTNDGGWLTQLLETKQGDIGKVLDILQPVNPARR